MDGDRVARVLGVLLSCVLAAGCGSSSSGSGSGGSGGTGSAAATAADVQAMCTAMCNHDAKCTAGGPACQVNCVQQVGDAAKFRKDFVDAYVKCENNADCSMSDDDCVLAATEQVSPNWQQDPARQSCMSRDAECQTSFTDDICGSLPVMTDQGRQEVADCLGKPCDQIQSCIDAIP